MSKTPICDKYSTNTEPHGFEVVPLYIAQQLEQQRDELLSAMIEFRKTGTHTEDFKKWLDNMISRVEGNL